MKVVFLGSKNSAGKNDVSEMLQSFQHSSKVAPDARTVYFEDLLFSIATEKQSVLDTATGQDMASADLVIAVNWYRNGDESIYRDVALALALYLQKQGVKIWNSEMKEQRSTTKLSAMMQLALAGMPIPHTVFSLDPNLLQSEAKEFPVVCKSATASRGRNNHLIQKAEELAKVVGNDIPNRYLLQPFIPNEGDYRVICFGGEPQLVLKRMRQGTETHLNNMSQGAIGQLLQPSALPAELLTQCRDICKLMGREMAGIDVLLPEGGLPPVFLEINAVPQLTSGAFVEEKLAALSDTIQKAGEL